jgi:hypothetical protein
MTISNAIKIILMCCLIGSIYYQYSQSTKYSTTEADFIPTKTVSGTFTFSDGGKLLQASWLDGHDIYWAASYAGGTSGFGRSFGIPNRSKVTATIVEIRTQSGIVQIAASIKSDSKVFVTRTPAELRELWLTESHWSLFSRLLFTIVFLVAPYLIVTGWISND